MRDERGPTSHVLFHAATEIESVTMDSRLNVCLAVSALLSIPTTAQAQIALIPERPSCLECRIEASNYLDLRVDSLIRGVPQVLMFGTDRLVAYGLLNNTVTLFDRLGTYLGQFGRRGRGPGEFNTVRLVAARGERVFVFDSQEMVHEFKADRTHVQSFRIQTTTRDVLIGEDLSLLTAGLDYSPDGIGFPLHKYSGTGKLVAHLGSDSAGYNPRQSFRTFRHVTGNGTTRFYAVHVNDPLVEEYDLTRSTHPVMTFIREPYTGKPSTRSPTQDVDTKRPSPHVIDARLQGQHLWLLVAVADAEWRPRHIKAVSPSVRDSIWDTMIEVLDLHSKRVVVRTRIPEFSYGFAGDGIIVTLTEETDGTEIVRLLQARLLQRPKTK